MVLEDEFEFDEPISDDELAWIAFERYLIDRDAPETRRGE